METFDEHVPVLIAGGGLVGLASSLFLAGQGIRALLVDRHPGVSIHGRARGINQRTMEIYRAFGVEQEILKAGQPFDEEAGVVRCETLAGPWEWLYEHEASRAWPDVTAGEFCMADQNTVEPILIKAAISRGATHRFNTELLSVDADHNGVTAVIEDRTTGNRRTVRSDYLIAADGNRSPVREKIGIARPDAYTFMHSMNIVFRADLSNFVSRRALFWIISNPPFGGGLVSTADPLRWQLTVGYDPATEAEADFTEERCLRLIRTAVGRADLPAQVENVASWEQDVGIATRYREGRIFLAGDSAHTWPPAGALGANTGVQDAHNLAWKLAFVLKGWACASLLDSYEAERRPIATTLAPMIIRHQQARMSGAPEPEDQLDPKGNLLGQSYQSASRAPHLWLDRDGERIGVHDLFHDTFVLLTRSDGWAEAAAELPVPVRVYRVGTDLVDLESQWDARYGDAAVLVRPDGYIAWTSRGPASAEILKAAVPQ